jgi:hypothetical protein
LVQWEEDAWIGLTSFKGKGATLQQLLWTLSSCSSQS